MFKDIQRVFGKFVTTERILILIVFVFLGYVLFSYSKSKDFVIDRMSNGSYDQSMSSPEAYVPTTTYINMPNLVPAMLGEQSSSSSSTSSGDYSLIILLLPIYFKRDIILV